MFIYQHQGSPTKERKISVMWMRSLHSWHGETRKFWGANEGNCKWVQIKHQLKVASQASVIVRKKKSLTVALLGNKLVYTVHWFSNHATRTRAIDLLEQNNCLQGHTKKAKLLIFQDPCHLACTTTHTPKIPATTPNHLSISKCVLLNLKIILRVSRWIFLSFDLKASVVFHSC